MAKNKNLVGTTPLTVSVTTGVNNYLELLAKTHLFGKTAAETAAQILSNEIKRLINSGELATYQARQLLGSDSDTDRESESNQGDYQA